MVCTCWFFISCNWFYFPSWAETHQHWKSVSAGCCLKENKTFFFTEKKRVKGDVSLRSKTINIPQRNMFFFQMFQFDRGKECELQQAAGCPVDYAISIQKLELLLKHDIILILILFIYFFSDHMSLHFFLPPIAPPILWALLMFQLPSSLTEVGSLLQWHFFSFS